MIDQRPTVTLAVDRERITAMVTVNADLLWNLSDRWADEREFEDIADYAEPIKAALPAGFELLRMKKRPFGFEFSIGTGAVYLVAATAKGLAWRRLQKGGK